MSRKSKFQKKVDAIKKVEKLTDKEARAHAKRSKIVRLKKKRLLLHGPNKQLLGTLTLTDSNLRIALADGIKASDVVNNGQAVALHFVIPPAPEKKKKSEKPLDGAPAAAAK